MNNLPKTVKEVLELITKKKTGSYTHNHKTNKSNKNTRLEYFYADQEGYKIHSKAVVFKGVLTERQTHKMFYKIMDHGFFPKAAGLKPLVAELAKLTGRIDTEGYHDITIFETTDSAATERDNVTKFYGRVMSVPNKRRF